MLVENLIIFQPDLQGLYIICLNQNNVKPPKQSLEKPEIQNI